MKNLKPVLAGVMAVSTFLGTGVISAEAAPTDSESSKATVTFTQNLEPTNPINPLEPTNPDKPTGGTGSTGALTIDYISDFDFGTQEISLENQFYYAALDKTSGGSEIPNFIQVTDKRGTNTGWELTVKQETQLKTDGDKELRGAQITLENLGAISPSGFSEDPDVENSVVLTVGNAIDVASAKAEELLEGEYVAYGTGTWAIKFGDDIERAEESVELFVPGASAKTPETYEATLTWTLMGNDLEALLH